MRSEEFMIRSQLAKEYRINFLGPIQPNRWPQNLSQLFADIQSVGETKFDSYRESLAVDSVDKPWRLQTKQRAERLSELAESCRNDRLNETGWRYRIEPEVLHRFTIEVACSRCRSRLWRSEIEPAVRASYKHAESLEERRRKRSRYHPRDECDHSLYNRGLNLLFADRAEAAIKHNPPLPIAPRVSGKYSEEPDRVYGLKQTDNLRMLLDSVDKRQSTKLLRETLEFSPFSHEPEPLLFPFLILEAKSGKVGDSAAVEMQSAFCIRRLLKVQHDLKLAINKESSWEAGPLVWFLAWYGESWSVSAGFVNPEGLNIHYNIVDLWTGNIRSKNGALQLLLIVDYIFDWARDFYRQSIIDELNILAERNSILRDPDVYSTLTREHSVFTEKSQEHQGSITYSNFECPPQDTRNMHTAASHGTVYHALGKDDSPRRHIMANFGILQTEEFDKKYRGHTVATDVYCNHNDGKFYASSCVYWLIKKETPFPTTTSFTIQQYQVFGEKEKLEIRQRVYYSTDEVVKNHYPIDHDVNQNAKLAGRLVVDLTRLKDSINPKEGPAKTKYYEIHYALNIEVDGLNIKISLFYEGESQGDIKICIAGAFYPETR